MACQIIDGNICLLDSLRHRLAGVRRIHAATGWEPKLATRQTGKNLTRREGGSGKIRYPLPTRCTRFMLGVRRVERSVRFSLFRSGAARRGAVPGVQCGTERGGLACFCAVRCSARCGTAQCSDVLWYATVVCGVVWVGWVGLGRGETG